MMRASHPARDVLERFVAGEEQSADVIDHVHACPSCAARCGRAEAARARFVAAHPAAELAARLARARRGAVRRLRVPLVLAAVVSAAGATLLVAGRSHPGSDEVRLKGEALAVFARDGDRTWQIAPGEALAPGVRLAFTYTTLEPRHLLVAGIDDAGDVSIYYSAPLPALRGQLPLGLELDERRGVERLIALFSARPLDAGTVTRALRRSFSLSLSRPNALEDLSLTLPAELGVTESSIWFRKP
jgi:hypothetical protein